MKKAIVLLILAASLLMLTACISSHKNAYDVKLTARTEGKIFRDSASIYNIDQVTTKELDKPIETQIKIGQKDITANLMSIKEYAHSSNVNIYLSKDLNTEYRQSTNIGSFAIKSKNGTVLCSYEKNTMSEQAARNHIETFMSSYIDIDHLDGYAYKCTTSVVVATPTASWKETKDTFYLPQNDTEKVVSYTFEFCKYWQGFETSDRVAIVCDANGNITDFYFNEYNVNWDTATFEDNLIQDAIEDYLKNNISREYKLLNYAIETQKLIYLDSKIQMMIAVELTLEKNNEEVVVLCSLLLTDG